MKKVLFIDRDGTIIYNTEDQHADNIEKLNFIPGSISSLSRISRELDFEMVMVAGNDDLNNSSFPEEMLRPVQNKMLQILRGEGVIFNEIIYDRCLPWDNSAAFKPEAARLIKYLSGGVDLTGSYVIGDQSSDIEFAKRLGCGSVFFNSVKSADADFSAYQWDDIYRYLKTKARISFIERKTSETNVSIELNLDGSGKSSIRTGIGFFDHLLEQITKHGYFDLKINVSGDLIVDEHHTVEDVAIALGKSFSDALGRRKGIERYGFVLPMDDSLAQVAIDLGGRSWLVWDAVFKREKIGEMPAELFAHFFKSFSDNAKCNLNIKAEGSNEHHKIEAIFKAFARALGTAVKQTDSSLIPSSKGSL